MAVDLWPDAAVRQTDVAVEAPSPGALPDILSADDAERYQRIFRLQDAGNSAAADRIAKKLENKLLMGHVLAHRYMHPRFFRSRYKELSAWLWRYSDHPQADRIYNLAKKRRPRNAGWPRRPSAKLFPVYAEGRVSAPRYNSPRARSKGTRRAVRRHMWRIKKYVKRQRFSFSERYLEQKKVKNLLDPVERDISRARIGAGWFFHGNAERAYELAGPAAARSGHRDPESHWIAGLAAFQLKQYVVSAEHFEAMAKGKWLSSWDRAGAEFWAARANMLGERPERVHGWLEHASKHVHTFYGQLAARMLDKKIDFEWELPELSPDLLDAMMKRKGGRRALALIQIDRDRTAERELRHMAIARDPRLGPALLAISGEANLPALALRAANNLRKKMVERPFGALYPIPEWKPTGGFKVDRALVFAFMRQESGFNTNAKSRVGARGLMQLMPATAGYIARRRFRGKRRNQLYDPEFNMKLGQKYLTYLMAHDAVQNNLLMLPAAYNGGPGNLTKWRRQAKRSNYKDPLLFIESIPAAETRNFIERVLANLWVYRARFNQPSPSLDSLAAGERPLYESLDGKSKRLALNVRDR